MTVQILIADDDLILRHIVEAALVREGFSVTLADDGYAAIEMIGQTSFDVVVLDHHMPLLDGFDVARRIDAIASLADRPRLIGISADPHGLEIRDQVRQMFDAIVQKPINIPALLHVVEASLKVKRNAARAEKLLQAWNVSGLDRRPRGRFASQPSREVLAQLEDAFDLSRPENPDCVLLSHPDDADRMNTLRTHGNLFALPTIDVVGSFGACADAGFRLYDPASWQDVATCVRDFAGRRLLLAPHFLHPLEFSEQLLAYVFVSGRNLRPSFGEAGAPTYPGFFATEGLGHATTGLVERGLLKAIRSPAMSKVCHQDNTAPALEFALTDASVEFLTGARLAQFA